MIKNHIDFLKVNTRMKLSLDVPHYLHLVCIYRNVSMNDLMQDVGHVESITVPIFIFDDFSKIIVMRIKTAFLVHSHKVYFEKLLD